MVQHPDAQPRPGGRGGLGHVLHLLVVQHLQLTDDGLEDALDGGKAGRELGQGRGPVPLAVVKDPDRLGHQEEHVLLQQGRHVRPPQVPAQHLDHLQPDTGSINAKDPSASDVQLLPGIGITNVFEHV